LTQQPFSAVAPALRVILTGAPDGLGTDKLAYSINPMLTALIAYRTRQDNFESLILDERHAQAWGMSRQDIWYTALRNMAGDRMDVQNFPAQTDADTAINVVRGVDWPAAPQLMRLPEVARDPMPYGAVAVLPDTNMMLFFVLRSQRSRRLLPFLYDVFQNLSRDHRPVTDQIMWYRAGRVVAMPARPDPSGQGVQIMRDDEFNRVLEHELPG
jgi:hypothetical protein